MTLICNSWVTCSTSTQSSWLIVLVKSSVTYWLSTCSVNYGEGLLEISNYTCRFFYFSLLSFFASCILKPFHQAYAHTRFLGPFCNWSFIIIKFPTFSLVRLILKSSLYDTNIITSVFLHLPITWYSFSILWLSTCLFVFKVCLLQHRVESSFFPIWQSVDFNRSFYPLIFNVIIVQLGMSM